jgi:hypothetical protein
MSTMSQDHAEGRPTQDEIKHVKIALPNEIRSLWPDETHTLCF